ncbi:hypothetical protein [uncultured Oscillibacter sp.]|uniref:hypothetical protein n=1 Tax=uncultured Oscillibacter sp. TaxID=876091 RepID=UPI00272C3ECE|nr:hypothetical protein [uncultured Oscillibacter sp.]
MRKVTEILPAQDHRPMELRHLRVAAYCRVSTELEEQTSRELFETINQARKIDP